MATVVSPGTIGTGAQAFDQRSICSDTGGWTTGLHLGKQLCGGCNIPAANIRVQHVGVCVGVCNTQSDSLLEAPFRLRELLGLGVLADLSVEVDCPLRRQPA